MNKVEVLVTCVCPSDIYGSLEFTLDGIDPGEDNVRCYDIFVWSDGVNVWSDINAQAVFWGNNIAVLEWEDRFVELEPYTEDDEDFLMNYFKEHHTPCSNCCGVLDDDGDETNKLCSECK